MPPSGTEKGFHRSSTHSLWAPTHSRDTCREGPGEGAPSNPFIRSRRDEMHAENPVRPFGGKGGAWLPFTFMGQRSRRRKVPISVQWEMPDRPPFRLIPLPACMRRPNRGPGFLAVPCCTRRTFASFPRSGNSPDDHPVTPPPASRS